MAQSPAVLGLDELPPQFMYQYWRPDRYEGVRHGSPAIGERLSLISLIARAHVPSSAAADRIWLGFFSDSARTLEVIVRLPERGYWMETADKGRNRVFSAASGFNSFSWDATIVRSIHATAGSLLALARPIDASATSALLPVVLWDSSGQLPSSVQVAQYDFAFLPNVLTDLQYAITPDDSSKPILTGKLIELPADKVASIPWKAGSRPDGVYILRGHATFHLDEGKTKEQDIGYRFVHRASILVEPRPAARR